MLNMVKFASEVISAHVGQEGVPGGIVSLSREVRGAG